MRRVSADVHIGCLDVSRYVGGRALYSGYSVSLMINSFETSIIIDLEGASDEIRIRALISVRPVPVRLTSGKDRGR